MSLEEAFMAETDTTELRRKNLCCISHGFASSAEDNPTGTAIIHLSTSSSSLLPIPFTYACLLSAVQSLSNRISLTLHQCDTETNSRSHIIGVYMFPSVEYIISVLSILRCGDAFLPLDPLWPEDRILSTISSSNASLVITNGSNSDNSIADVASCRVICIDMKELSDDKINQNCDIPWPCEGMRKYCYVMYTSGSTGTPKGVCGTEAGILNRYAWMQEKFPVSKEDIVLFKTSISFVDHIQEFLSPLLIGSTLLIPPFNELKSNPPLLVNIIKEYNVSRLTAVPSLMKAILVSLENSFSQKYNPLKVLILSGEIFSIQLWKDLARILPNTIILNLYGSTEVSGDCTYFNCENLPNILNSELLTSVPIGIPISNCKINLSDVNEIQVSGTCLFVQYLNEPINNDNFVFKTGDFARELRTADLQFIGRKDRLVKINGQRVSLVEIENTLMDHPDINNVAVNMTMKNGIISHINAYFVAKSNLKNKEGFGLERENDLEISLRRWVISKLVPVMVPRYYFELDELPVTLSGKIDYEKLSCLKYKTKNHNIETDINSDDSRLNFVKQAFKEVLSINEIHDNDDFFAMGGDSLSAAQIAYKLGIDMRSIYIFPTPLKLLEALPNKINHKIELSSTNNNSDQGRKKPKLITEKSSRNSNDKSSKSFISEGIWAASRCNRFMHGSRCNEDICQIKVSKDSDEGFLREIWKVNLGSCVDASPLIVCINGEMSLFIGSHSHNFLRINALDGCIRWEVKLEGRVECSATITNDFSQVVVGCYKGNIYFVDFKTGDIHWTFQTGGEVKMQPLVDEKRNLIWCGSYDKFLYALNYKEKTCFHKISCGGSIYSSPCIDKLNEILYVVSTSGLLTAINLEGSTFEIKWRYEAGVPAFGSLALDTQNGNVICCLVNGNVIVLSSSGELVWKVNVGGPIFAGACISSVIPNQVLVCSRNGFVYSFDTRNGRVIWEYEIGDPITASPFVDEHCILTRSSERLVCVCSSSGHVRILRIKSNYEERFNNEKFQMVREFAELDFPSDIFSSPVMIGCRVFIGCRDDHVRCLEITI